MSVRDIAVLFLLGAIWGASFLFMRIAAPEFGPVPLIAVRVGIAAVFLAFIVSVRRGWVSIRGHELDIAVVGVTNTAIPFSLFAFSVLSVSAGFGSILNSTAALFAALFAFLWLREQFSLSRIAGVVVGFVGVAVLVSHAASFEFSGATLAILAGLTAALLYGFAATYTKRRLSGVDPLAVAAGSLIAATLALTPLALLSLPSEAPSLLSWAYAAALGILCTAIAYLFYFQLIQRIGASKATLVAYLIPVFGVLWGVIFLQETVTLNMVLGGVVVLAGTALATGLLAVPQKPVG